MKKMYQIFVSSTYDDLKEERNEVIKALLEQGCIPIGMEHFPASDDSQWKYIKKLIKECDYYVLIAAGRYGSELPNGMSYTEREYRYAIKNKIPVLSFVHSDIQQLPAKDVDKDLKKLKCFLRIVEKKLFKKWRDKAELGGVMSRSIHLIKEDKPRVGWIKGDSKTEEHLELASDHNDLYKKYKKIKSQSLISSKYFHDDFEHVIPSLEKILNKILDDKIDQSEPLKIRVLGVCFHKSFPFLKRFIEENCASGKRIEIRLSKLDRSAFEKNILDNIWDDYYGAYTKLLKEFCKNIKKIDGANVSLKISKYSHMPNWHGVMVNNTHLFLSACVWKSENELTVGENHYIYYKKDKKNASQLHNQKVLQFNRWFDYSRYKGTVVRKKQFIFDTTRK